MIATSTIADYVGRTVDLCVFQGSELGIDVEILLDQSIALPNTQGLVVTGVQKLVQRFLLTLLTEIGSMIYQPDAGCQFMRDARSGHWRTSADVIQSFYASMIDVRRQIIGAQLSTDPPDEQLGDVTILSVVLSPQDTAVLRLMMTTQAGSRVAFIAPIGIVP